VVNWSRLLCGGAGWTKNAERYDIIQEIKFQLDWFRDFDNQAALAEAKRLMEELT
jgi:hypothetical protein